MSEKRLIAVDIDDVLVETAPWLVRTMRERHSSGITLDDYYNYHPDTWGFPTLHEALMVVNELVLDEEYLQTPPIPEAKFVINSLMKNHRFAAVTARYSLTEPATVPWLDSHFPGVFEGKYFLSHYDGVETKKRSKAEVCLEIGAACLIDDKPSHLIEAAEHGVHGILFGEYPWNTAHHLPSNVIRARNWSEVAILISELDF